MAEPQIGERERAVAGSYRGSWLREGISGLEWLLQHQSAELAQASQWCAEAIASDGLVHLFGSGHSRIPVEEMFPRYGSYPGFNPIVELSTTFHTQIVGNNGQRQAMFIERTPGLAQAILDNYQFGASDVYIGFSVSGTNALPVEMLQGAKDLGLRTIAVTALSAQGAMASAADLVIDLGVTPGDAIINVAGMEAPVGPLSSLIYIAVVNEIKVQTAALLSQAGVRVPVLAHRSVVGESRSHELFSAAYDEHARRASRILRGATHSAPALAAPDRK